MGTEYTLEFADYKVWTVYSTLKVGQKYIYIQFLLMVMGLKNATSYIHACGVK